MNKPVKHHFVPEFLLRQFTDSENKLHIFDKRRLRSGVYSSAPKGAFHKRNLNSFVLKDGLKNTDLETWYADLEAKVSPVISKLIASAHERLVPKLTPNERQIWDLFFYHQQKRAPNVFGKLGCFEDFEENLPDLIARFERDHGAVSEEQKKI